MERRFHPILRQFFAVLTIITNVVAFLAAVFYGGADRVAKSVRLGTMDLDHFARGRRGSWAIYGGLRSVAWTDFFTVIVMVVGGVMVTLLGLDMLSGDSHSIVEGWQVMIERNQAHSGVWKRGRSSAMRIHCRTSTYDRLSVIQPVTHATNPWPSLFLGLFSVSIWYNVINQFMIQRVLGAKIRTTLAWELSSPDS